VFLLAQVHNAGSDSIWAVTHKNLNSEDRYATKTRKNNKRAYRSTKNISGKLAKNFSVVNHLSTINSTTEGSEDICTKK
jgi:hypothetical protein